jgi:ATP-binding cassette subfamily B (MDR/TAP) protein 1
MSDIPYASATGSIMYAMLSTRPDVALALSLTSRYQSNPFMSHWNMVKSILKYLRNMKDMVLVYGESEEVIRPFCITILYHNLLLFIDIFHI